MKKTLLALMIGAGLSVPATADAKPRPNRSAVTVTVGWVWVPPVRVGVRYHQGYWSHPVHGHVVHRAHRHRPPVRTWIPGHYEGYGRHRHWVPGHYRYRGR